MRQRQNPAGPARVHVKLTYRFDSIRIDVNRFDSTMKGGGGDYEKDDDWGGRYTGDAVGAGGGVGVVGA
jgi:hypothetical protein